MLEEMKNLALDYLWSEKGQGEVPNNLDEWFKDIRAEKPEQIFPYLVEASEKIEKYYTLSPDPDDSDLAVLEVSDFQKRDNVRLPFNQPSGSQSPALGPVIKRTYATGKGAGPTIKIQASTLKSFETLAQENKPWSSFFESAWQTFTRPKLFMATKGETLIAEPGQNAYSMAVKKISERQTVLLAFKDNQGKLPGDHPEYIEYLQEILAQTKYATKAVPSVENGLCSLSSEEGVTVFPNALTGAGVNIANIDRLGAFPGILEENAALGYALSLDSADLLYIYKNYVSKLFLADIAGNRALIIPQTQIRGKTRQQFFKQVQNLIQTEERVEEREERLMRLLGNERAVTSLDILWANFGQKIEKLQGLITDILPSRLRKITEVNERFNNSEFSHPIFPKYRMYDFDLTLKAFSEFLKRPGGKKAQSINASQRLFQFKRNLAAAIYHKHSFETSYFWKEVFVTAQWYLNQAIEDGDAWNLLNEGYSTKNQKPYWTFAGWMRHLAQFIHYLTKLEVFPMPEASYQPESELLKPYFEESGIDTNQKAFSFLVGILYGKVMQVQGAKGVNVGANALTWLRRLTLTGEDLPDFYCKVREKLLTYETEGNKNVREVLREVGYLGMRIGDDFNLSQTTTCYFLLLGQSVTVDVLPSKDTKTEEEDR